MLRVGCLLFVSTMATICGLPKKVRFVPKFSWRRTDTIAFHSSRVCGSGRRVGVAASPARPHRRRRRLYPPMSVGLWCASVCGLNQGVPLFRDRSPLRHHEDSYCSSFLRIFRLAVSPGFAARRTQKHCAQDPGGRARECCGKRSSVCFSHSTTRSLTRTGQLVSS